MKRIHLLIIFALALIIPGLANAQSPVWKWARDAGSPGYTEQASGVAVDKAGSSYVSGRFIDSRTLGTGKKTATVYSYGGEDVFLAKYNAGGTLMWVRTAGTTFD